MAMKIYHSINPGFRLGADEIQQETRLADGRILKGSGIITFANNLLRTDDLKVQKVIEKCHEYFLGRVRRISEEECQNILATTKEVQETITSHNEKIDGGGKEDDGYSSPEDGDSSPDEGEHENSNTIVQKT